MEHDKARFEIVHEKATKYTNRLMIVMLCNASNVSFAKLNTDNDYPSTFIPTNVTALGYGIKSTNDFSVSPVLLQIKYRLQICPNIADTICAGGDGVKGACGGDSGSPLLDDKNVVVGMFNPVDGNCAIQGYVDIYTRISSYQDWIKKTLCIHSAIRPKDCNPCWFCKRFDFLCKLRNRCFTGAVK